MTLLAVAALLDRSLSPLTWYLTRASALTLYLLLWLSVMLGLGITTKLFDHLAPRSVIYSVHTFTTQLAYGFLALHILSLLADSHLPFTVREALLPFASNAPEPWTGLGIVAMYLLVLIGVSGVARRVISFRAWRALHMLAFPLYALALAHGIGAGSDTGANWSTVLYLGTGLSVLWLMAYRLLRWNRRYETAPVQPGAPPFDRFSPHPRLRES
jgi:methionine sulfoxide reductase heme-binding subunit